MRANDHAALSALLLFLASTQAPAQEFPAIPLGPSVEDRCLAVLRAGLLSDEFWPAMHAAEALKLAGKSPEVLATLAGRTALDDQQQCGLAREMVRAGDRRQIAALLGILVKPGSNGHTHAAESLFKVAEVGDGAGLRVALQQDDDLKLKLMAAAALARCGHPTALGTVRSFAAHQDPEVRKSAIWILGQLGTPGDIPQIRAVAGTDDPLAKAYCDHALACLGDGEARQRLVKNLRSENPAVRTYAAEFAGYCRVTEAREELIKLLDDQTLDVRVRAAQSLIVLPLSPHVLGLPAAAVSQEDIRRDVYPATAENPRYSEGSVAVLQDGSLLYATTEFIGGRADHATAHIVAKKSSDGGRHWGEAHVLQENTGKQNVMSVTLRRLLPGRADGPLGMFYLIKNSPADLQAYLRISSDEAATFGQPIRVTAGDGYHVMNNDRITVLASGRLICPVAWTADIAKAGSHQVSFCYLSDDAGRTWWRSAGQVDQPRRGAMEPEVVELAEGKLLMIVRTQLGHIATSQSSDGGEHWSAPAQLSVTAPESPATIRRIPATGDLLLIWNNTFTAGAGHGGKRTPLTAAVSSDEGRTWRNVRNLEDQPDAEYAYTSVTFYRDRLLLSYYVADGKTGRISSRFRSLPVAWLYQQP